MRIDFAAKHRHIWPVSWLCDALEMSPSCFHAWFGRAPSGRSREDQKIGAKVRASVISNARINGAPRVWCDVLAGGLIAACIASNASCGLKLTVPGCGGGDCRRMRGRA